MRQSPEAMDVVVKALVRHIADDPKGAAEHVEAALQKARDEERAAVVDWIEQDNISLGFRELAREIRRGEHRREG